MNEPQMFPRFVVMMVGNISCVASLFTAIITLNRAKQVPVYVCFNTHA